MHSLRLTTKEHRLAELELAGDLNTTLAGRDARQAVPQNHIEGVCVRDAAISGLAVDEVGPACLAVLVTDLVTQKHCHKPKPYKMML